MKWLFGAAFVLIAYSYFGYPLFLWLRKQWRPCPVNSAPTLPSLSILLAVSNEAAHLPQKLQNLVALRYPADRFEVIVVSDGSTDETNALLAQRIGPRFRVISFDARQGKALALNAGVEAARGDVVVFTDARQWIEADALQNLVSGFADPTVGCVSGELMLGDPGSVQRVDGEGLYWRIEKIIRQWESESGSVVGATGAFYAVRRELFRPMPAGTILDDVWVPMHVARQGRRVVFASKAIAWDPLRPSSRQEFRRKVRTLTGNYQLVQRAPWLLTTENPIFLEFISHKLTRLLVPFALVLLLVTSFLLWNELLYRCAAVSQVAFYGIGLLAPSLEKFGFLGRLARVAWTFEVLNAAALVAFLHFLTGREAIWARAANPVRVPSTR